MTKPIQKNIGIGSEEGGIVFVIGPSSLQNDLLVNYLDQHTRASCRSYASLNEVELDPAPAGGSCLFLLDAEGLNLDDFWRKYKQFAFSIKIQNYLALFNVADAKPMEREALDRGFHGVFYNQDGLESFAKGTMAILKGEFWFSRKTMTACLVANQRRRQEMKEHQCMLTFREKEILIQMATGAGNKEIADILCISPHTVKTHIYNSYKKLGIQNRLQASLWATKNL